ncbi:hypothetical protein [Stappia stellulata]|uniref:hypothetical protein n=1 Tax=Stappia stellulata TaxID=71235 RepID=UPI0012EB3D11|nr:hypothetical protein [Stappia stellulata]
MDRLIVMDEGRSVKDGPHEGFRSAAAAMPICGPGGPAHFARPGEMPDTTLNVAFAQQGVADLHRRARWRCAIARFCVLSRSGIGLAWDCRRRAVAIYSIHTPQRRGRMIEVRMLDNRTAAAGVCVSPCQQGAAAGS